MQLTSTAFVDGQEMNQKYGKKIQNVSLPVAWNGAPPNSKSFALVMIDRHPVARNYCHWLLIDIPASVSELAEGVSAPKEARALKEYTGPFPPSGTHSYELTVYALDTDKLQLPAKPKVEISLNEIESHTIEKALLVGNFTKVK